MIIRCRSIFWLALVLATGTMRQANSASPGAGASVAVPATAALPDCIADVAQVSRIEIWIASHRNTDNKYDAYQDALKHLAESAVLARLVYAEVLAANCPERTDEVLLQIDSVIRNRIAKRGGDVRGVVFQRDQFASSLNVYGASRYRDFLCPQDERLWAKVTEQINQDSQLPADVVHYFLYRHDPRWKKEPWSLAEFQSERFQARDCIRVFRNPQWR